MITEQALLLMPSIKVLPNSESRDASSKYFAEYPFEVVSWLKSKVLPLVCEYALAS